MKRALGTTRKDLPLVQKEDANALLFTSPPNGAFPGDRFLTVRLLLQQQRAGEILAPVLQRPLHPPPPGQVPAPTGSPAPPETSAGTKQPPSAYPSRPGSASGGPPAAGVPAAAAAAAAAAHPGTRQPGGPSRPGSARLPRQPGRARTPGSGPCASAPPAHLPSGPVASPPAEPWGRFTHPGHCLAPHRSGEPSLRRPGPHRASPATARAPEGGGAGRRDSLARAAAPGASSAEPRLHSRRGRGRMEPRRERAGVPTVPVAARRRARGSEGGTGAARSPHPRAGSRRLRGRGCEPRGPAAAGRARGPPSRRRLQPLRRALLARLLGLGLQLRLRLPGRECYCSSERRLIDKEST